MKKRLPVFIGALSLVLLVGGCGSSNGLEKNGNPSEQQSVVLEKATGTFEGKFEEEFIDINVNGSKKMYRYVSDVSTIVSALEQDEKVSIAYETTNKGELIIHLITRLNPKIAIAPETTKNKSDKAKPEEVKEEEITEETPFSVDIPVGFVLVKDTIYYGKDKAFNVLIETLPYSTEIQKERWRASPILKEIGILKEISNNYIPGTSFEKAEFIFAGYGEEVTGYIAVKWINHELYRFTMTVPYIDDFESLEYQLWDALSTTKKKD